MSASLLSSSCPTSSRRTSTVFYERANLFRRSTVKKSFQESIAIGKRRCYLPPRSVATDKTAAGKSESSSKKAADLKNAIGETVTPEIAKALYKDMVLGRDFEERCAEMYYRGKMFGYPRDVIFCPCSMF